MVSTVAKDEAAVRKYIHEPEAKDRRLDQLEMSGGQPGLTNSHI
jgi:hypothetical protein